MEGPDRDVIGGIGVMGAGCGLAAIPILRVGRASSGMPTRSGQ